VYNYLLKVHKEYHGNSGEFPKRSAFLLS